MTPCVQRFSFPSVFCLRLQRLPRKLPHRERISASTATSTPAMPRCRFCANPFPSLATGSALLPVKNQIHGLANVNFFAPLALALHCSSQDLLPASCVMSRILSSASLKIHRLLRLLQTARVFRLVPSSFWTW